MKTILASLLLLVIPGLVIASDQAAVNPAPATPPADPFRHTPASFRKHPPAQKVLERGNIDYGLLSAAVFHATNAQRARHGLPPLAPSEALRRAAQIHTHDMVIGGFFAHDNPRNPARRTPWQRMAAEGVTNRYCSENIAKIFVSELTYLSAADTIVAMWMKSPGHRRNLLDRNMRYLGCGVHSCRCPQFHLLATQNFSFAAPRRTVRHG